MSNRSVGPVRNVSESDARLAQIVTESQLAEGYAYPAISPPKPKKISFRLDEQGHLVWEDREIMAKKFRERAEDLPTCTGYVRAFASKIYEGMIMLGNLDCHCWRCRKCGPWKKVEWLNKFLPLVKDEEYLEKQEIDAEDWERKRRELNRGGWKFIRFTMVNGNYVLLTNQKNGGITIIQEARRIVLYKIINLVAFGRRPISASRNWGLPSPARTTESNWLPLDTGRYSFQKSIEILKANGIEPTVKYCKVPGDNFHTAIFSVMNSEDLLPILWKLGVWNREKGEIRNRGRPTSEAA